MEQYILDDKIEDILPFGDEIVKVSKKIKNGLIGFRFKRCSWCNNILYTRPENTVSFCCIDCKEESRDFYSLKEARRKYYNNNQKNKYAENPEFREQMKARTKLYYQNNKDKMRAYAKAHRSKLKAKKLELM